jgi:hypothetical protein
MTALLRLAPFYNGTFIKAFRGCQPNSTVQMRSIDISRVKDGNLIEHWDEFVFQQVGAANVRKAEGQ